MRLPLAVSRRSPDIVKDFSELEKKLAIEFKNKELLRQAFTHRSFLNESQGKGLEHNERLEFLGDAVLEQVITEYLYLHYPKDSEGVLTSWRAALVNANMLSAVAQKLEIEDFLLLSKGELKEKGKSRSYILANAFEALIGSMYLDQGMDFCKNFIEKHIASELPRVINEGLFRDAKSHFQEEAQEKTGLTPTYKVMKEWGPDHEKTFSVGVFLGDKLVAQGEGFSKQEAEEAAASGALRIKQCHK